MRLIKFRAWDDDRMRYGVDLLFTDGKVTAIGGYTCQSSDSYFRQEHFQLMQFTGLKDTKGVEIYDGDIVKEIIEGNEFILLVAWDEARLSFDLKEDGSWTYTNDDWSSETREVIGNLYETPELLNKEK